MISIYKFFEKKNCNFSICGGFFYRIENFNAVFQVRAKSFAITKKLTTKKSPKQFHLVFQPLLLLQNWSEKVSTHCALNMAIARLKFWKREASTSALTKSERRFWKISLAENFTSIRTEIFIRKENALFQSRLRIFSKEKRFRQAFMMKKDFRRLPGDENAKTIKYGKILILGTFFFGKSF